MHTYGVYCSILNGRALEDGHRGCVCKATYLFCFYVYGLRAEGCWLASAGSQ